MYYIIIIVFLLTTIFIKANGEEDSKTIVIQILTKKPDMPDKVYDENWEIEYQSKINQFFMEKVSRLDSDLNLKNVELNFTFYDFGVIGKSDLGLQFDYLNDVAESLWASEYDMVILDERTLFCEVSLMESEWVEFYLNTRKPYDDLLVNLSKEKYFEKKDESTLFDFHDSRAIKDARNNNGHLYGLPYELDFDVLYYDSKNKKAKPLADHMKILSWDVLINQIQDEPLKISLGDDDNMLNFFLEYCHHQYNLTKAYDPDYFSLFYNDTGIDLFQSFYDLVSRYTEYDVQKTLNISQEDAMESFMLKESIFFKGKASYSKIFDDYNNNSDNNEDNNDSTMKIDMTLPPKHISAIFEKYLVLNKHSTIDRKILIEMALQLTSKEMQLFRAENFGSIPTFDITKKEKYSDISSYCQNHWKICDYLEIMERLYVKDTFNLKYGTPFYEIEVLLIPIIKAYLEDYNIPEMIFSFKNINELITYNLGVYGVMAYIFTLVVALILFYICYLVYRYKKHPLLRVISPIFCIMIIIGCTLNMLKVLQNFPPYSEFRAKIDLIYRTISTNLIYIPMFVVTHRIYRIFKSNSVILKFMSDKKLIIIIVLIITVTVIFRLVIVFTQEFYCLPFGSLRSPRYPEWLYTNRDIFQKYYETYLRIVFICLLFMIITTGNISKRFGDICYVFIVFVLNIVDFIVERLLQKLSHEYYPQLLLLIIMFNAISYFMCVYFLVGSRLFFILLFFPGFEEKEQIVSVEDLSQFVGLKSRKEYNDAINKIKIEHKITNIVSTMDVNKLATSCNNDNNISLSTIDDNKLDTSCISDNNIINFER